jgi:hypothetical protein
MPHVLEVLEGQLVTMAEQQTVPAFNAQGVGLTLERLGRVVGGREEVQGKGLG